MGPLLVTGAGCFGAAIAMGLITAAAGRALSETAEPLSVRAVYILLAAFIEGMGVLGVVIGILAIAEAKIGDPSSAVVAAVPAVGGSVAGIILALRGGRSAVRILGLSFIVGLGYLGVVVGVLAIAIGEGARLGMGDAPFAIIAIVYVVAPIGLGISGVRSIADVGRARSVGPSGIRQPGTVEFLRIRVVGRAALFQTVTIVATVAATLLVVLGGPASGR